MFKSSMSYWTELKNRDKSEFINFLKIIHTFIYPLIYRIENASKRYLNFSK